MHARGFERRLNKGLLVLAASQAGLEMIGVSNTYRLVQERALLDNLKNVRHSTTIEQLLYLPHQWKVTVEDLPPEVTQGVDRSSIGSTFFRFRSPLCSGICFSQRANFFYRFTGIRVVRDFETTVFPF